MGYYTNYELTILENEDICVSYYKNGKSHYNKAVIVLDEYDENKLV